MNTVGSGSGGALLDALLAGRVETSALAALSATPAKKKKTRRGHNDVGLDNCDTDMASEQRTSSRTEQDGVVSASSAHATRHRHRHHHHHARTTDTTTAASVVVAPTELSTSSQQQSRTASHSRTPSSSGTSAHRRVSSTAKRDPIALTPEVATASLARQSLTSSASAMRPSKQRLERTRLLSHAHVECRSQLEHTGGSRVGRGGNNDRDLLDDDDDNNNSNASGFEPPESMAMLGADDYRENDRGAAPRAAVLPSRARLYRNTMPRRGADSDVLIEADNDYTIANSSGSRRVSTSSRASSLAAANAVAVPLLADRPPSRQRHAFPTHLVDSNGFFAQQSGSSNRVSRDKKTRSAIAVAVATVPYESVATERPPSRYMTKAKHSGATGPSGSAAARSASTTSSPTPQDGRDGAATVAAQRCSSTSSSHLPSRRCVDSVYSLNQVNHDPKTDGFAEVDESVPPPFRIEITTALHHHHGGDTVAPSAARSRLSSSSANRSRMQSRRRPSFSNQEQLAQSMAADHDFRTSMVLNPDATDDYIDNDRDRSSSSSTMDTKPDAVGRSKPLEWFDHDDQINNAHLFETVVSLSSPQRDEHDADSYSPHSSSSFSSPSAPSTPSPCRPVGTAELESDCGVRGPTAQAVPQSSTSRRGHERISDQQWILASSNPFFIHAASSPLPSKFDDMDPETALAAMTLYEPGDLVTIATEMSDDLHLDDFIIGELQPMPLSITLPAGAGDATASRPLHTSLGKDFLSLFAQH